MGVSCDAMGRNVKKSEDVNVPKYQKGWWRDGEMGVYMIKLFKYLLVLFTFYSLF